jgi:hypothetical protein
MPPNMRGVWSLTSVERAVRDDEAVGEVSDAALKVGCNCRFTVDHVEGTADVRVTYHEAGHVDTAGEICHGPAAEHPTRHLGRLSDEFRSFVRALAIHRVPFPKIQDGKMPGLCVSLLVALLPPSFTQLPCVQPGTDTWPGTFWKTATPCVRLTQ